MQPISWKHRFTHRHIVKRLNNHPAGVSQKPTPTRPPQNGFPSAGQLRVHHFGRFKDIEEKTSLELLKLTVDEVSRPDSVVLSREAFSGWMLTKLIQ